LEFVANLMTAERLNGFCFAGQRGFASVGATATRIAFVAELRAKAEKGDAGAQFEFGGVLYRGEFGVASDPAEAAKWIRKAAEQDLAPAQNILGLSYQQGRGVTADAREAVTWWRKAARQNNVDAQCSLGASYATGHGVAQDAQAALTWFRKAAEQDYAVAQCNLGECYATGQGVATGPVEAAQWPRKAAERAPAQSIWPSVIPRAGGEDEVEAVKWFRRLPTNAESDTSSALLRRARV
jgi:TPR repeat protein